MSGGRRSLALRDKAGSLSYLRKAGGAADEACAADEEGEEQGEGAELCPICLDNRSAATEWGMTLCGHGGCYDCLTQAVSESRSCPLCKKPLTEEGIFECGTSIEAGCEAEAAGLQLLDEYGTKLTRLCIEVAAIKEARGKAVVFSAWTRLLTLAGDALAANGVRVASLVGSLDKKRAALADFSAFADVLLVPLFGGASGAGGGGAAGLTLTQASTVFLLEPALQPGIERQAAGRIARIGQSEETRCVRLLIKDTVETKIVEWQRMRLADGASAAPQLSLNDWVHIVS